MDKKMIALSKWLKLSHFDKSTVIRRTNGKHQIELSDIDNVIKETQYFINESIKGLTDSFMYGSMKAPKKKTIFNGLQSRYLIK